MGQIRGVSPFLKWPGGKRRLLSQIIAAMPEQYGTFYEPFLGGGALFFHLAPCPAVLSDVNHDLITTYQVVRDTPHALLDLLADHARDHSHAYYYTQRESQPRDPLAIAARLLYLNRTAYNGLYRVNKRGAFNVPIGTYRNPQICQRDAILAASAALQSTDIVQGDFAAMLSAARASDFVYCDPPYIAASASANFTSYVASGFRVSDHERLRDAAVAARARGVYVVLSNSDTPLARSLYAGWHLHAITARRSISCKGTDRRAVGELLICSHDIVKADEEAS